MRKVAQQFESLFTRMMLKSMRDAVRPGSDLRQRPATDVPGDGRRSARRAAVQGTRAGTCRHAGAPAAADGRARGRRGRRRAGQRELPAAAPASHSERMQRSASAAAPAGIRATATTAARRRRARRLRDKRFRPRPLARRPAGRPQLGVDPRNLLAQAALETNWGRNLPQDAAGRSSHNLFGVKASARLVRTARRARHRRSFRAAAAASTHCAPFGSYGSASAELPGLCRAAAQQSRATAAALNTGSDVQAFAAALQRGGYATDPDYARKIGSIAQ